MNIVPRLHDATLQTVTFHWEDGVVRIRLSTGVNGSGVVVLEALGVVRAVCPRALPWGPSDSVNEAIMQQVSDGQLLSVEMQSGDVLEVCCKEVLVRSAENERYDEPKPLRGLRP
jgi:hypothetical protein